MLTPKSYTQNLMIGRSVQLADPFLYDLHLFKPEYYIQFPIIYKVYFFSNCL